MRKFLVVSIAVLVVGFVPLAFAQDDELNRGEIGVFGDYFRSSTTGNTNMAGVGARLSFNVHRFVQIEGEMAYDFSQVFTESFTDAATGGVDFNRSRLRILNGLGGVKIHAPLGAFRPFVTLKGGAVNFRFDDAPVTFGSFGSSVADLRTNNVKPVFAPGGGIELFIGWFGIRADASDVMFWDNGTHHNLKATFGPVFRF